MGGCSEENVAPAWCRVGQRAPDGAGRAVNPLRGPAQPLAAVRSGACEACLASKRHPWGLGRGIHAADGPAPPGPRCLPIPASAVGWLLEARAEAVRTNGPHPPKHKTPQQRRAASEAMNPLCPRFRGRPRPRDTAREWERGCAGPLAPWMAPSSPMDGFTACPALPLSHSKPIATTRQQRPPMNRPNRTTHPRSGTMLAPVRDAVRNEQEQRKGRPAGRRDPGPGRGCRAHPAALGR